MSEINPNLFEEEMGLVKEAKVFIKSKNYYEEALADKFVLITERFEKLIKDVEKIVKISDGQQEYLHRIQNDLKKEIEDRIRAEEKLRYFAAIDTLTGAYNRGMGLSFLENEVKTIRRKAGFFSVCYIDINALKYVNDHFGHGEGDELLILICQLITQATRDNDILCRLGGDEFIILFPNFKEEDAQKSIDEVIFNMEEKNKIQLKPYKISFSYGIVQVNHSNMKSIDEIIQQADNKMYEHKKKYKDSIVLL